MLPTHGAVTSSVQKRVHQLLEHHEDRLDVVLGHVGAGCRTAYEIADRMSWTRHNRSFDELDVFHGMAAVLEVAVHLELLEYRGQLKLDDIAGANHYSEA